MISSAPQPSSVAMFILTAVELLVGILPCLDFFFVWFSTDYLVWPSFSFSTFSYKMKTRLLVGSPWLCFRCDGVMAGHYQGIYVSDMINLTEHKMPELLLPGSIKNQAEPCFAPVDHRLFVFSTLFSLYISTSGFQSQPAK